MRICIFSDIHGNAQALEKMLAIERENVDTFFFLGDICGYFYEQGRCISLLREIPDLYAIQGNHDQYYLQSRKDLSLRQQLVQKYGCSYEMEWTNEEIQYVARLPLTQKLQLDGKCFALYHGGPEDYLEQRIYPDTELALDFGAGYDYVFLGHSHYVFAKTVGKTQVINPGSLGQPRDGKGFRYCVLDTARDKLEYKTVAIDAKAALRPIEEREAGSYNCTYLAKKYL